MVRNLRVFGQRCQCLVNRRIVGFDDQTLKRQHAQVNVRNGGQRLVGQDDIDVVALFPVFVRHFDVRLHRGAIARSFEMVGHRAINAFLHRFAHQALAELLFQQCHRDFALAKALHFDTGLGFGQLFVDLCLKFGGGYRDGITAFQTFVECLSDLHVCSHSVNARISGLIRKFAPFYARGGRCASG